MVVLSFSFTIQVFNFPSIPRTNTSVLGATSCRIILLSMKAIFTFCEIFVCTLSLSHTGSPLLEEQNGEESVEELLNGGQANAT